MTANAVNSFIRTGWRTVETIREEKIRIQQKTVFTREDLQCLRPEHGTFVGIDSDGCVFDSMEIKQKRCFHKLIVSHWHLEQAEKLVRETAEFVNLYSRHRGTNRFVCLLRTFDFLRERPELKETGVKLPDFEALRRFVHSGLPLSHPVLGQMVRETGDRELAEVLAWSNAVNADVERIAENIKPFKWAVDSLDRIRKSSDAVCVSQTPAEALIREWRKYDLIGHVRAIAGQELGTKVEHLQLAAAGKYEPGAILMIGDAPGDLNAAHGVEAHFYPINPGHEVESWKRFLDEAYDRFLDGSYGGTYENRMISEFNRLLPETPCWRRRDSGRIPDNVRE